MPDARADYSGATAPDFHRLPRFVMSHRMRRRPERQGNALDATSNTIRGRRDCARRGRGIFSSFSMVGEPYATVPEPTIGACGGRYLAVEKMRGAHVKRAHPQCPGFARLGIYGSVLLLCVSIAIPAAAFTPLQNKCFNGSADERIAACTKLIETDSDSIWSSAYYDSRGNALSDKRECDSALSDLNIAVEQWKASDGEKGWSSANAFLHRGNVWLTCKGDVDKALQDYEASRDACPGECEATQSSIAMALYNKGDLDRSIAEFDSAIEMAKRIGKKADKNRSMSLSNRGVARRDEQDFDHALSDFNEALRIDPSNHFAYTGRGETWRLKGDLRRSIADLDKGIQLDPHSPLKFAMRCRTYRYLGEIDHATADCNKAIQFGIDFPPGYTERGLVFERSGDSAHAKADFETALTQAGAGLGPLADEAHETARARLAALGAGVPQPIIPAAPGKAHAPNAVPTPPIAIPATTGTPAPEGRRVALVIGISSYTIGTLPNPQHDAEAISDVLKSLGFASVTLIKDASREALVNALRAFADEAEKSDWAVVYYAGHGVEIGGVNYLLPIDVKLATDRDVQFEAIPLDQVLASTEQAKKLRLVFLDACRDNPFVANMRLTASSEPVGLGASDPAGASTRSVGRGLGRITLNSQGGMLVFYAAKDGQTALDGEGADSPFAVALAQRLATPGVEINKLLRLVRDDVMEATAGRQEPYTYGSLPGREDFFFVNGR
jgi:tetratricopeptide (TPR) repeat protein